MNERIIIGCMSGTSLDGIDAVKLRITQDHQNCQIKVLESYDLVYNQTLQHDLKNLSLGQAVDLKHLLTLQQELGQLHVELLQKFKADYELIVLHGQTVYHAPPLSWQIAQPHLVATRLHCTCLYDLRMADLAHGGQGAPISPLADAILFQSPNETRAIVNLGGFINLTLLSADLDHPKSVQGFDLCICNQWLDQLATEYFQKPYDENGNMARLGQNIPALCQTFYRYFKSQWQCQRSLGSQDDRNLLLNDPSISEHSAHDVLKSSCQALAQLIIEACQGSDRIILAGGGCHNQALLDSLNELSSIPVELSDQYGLPFQQREAALMALLGHLCLDKQPITLPQVTGCQKQSSFLSGSWVYP